MYYLLQPYNVHTEMKSSTYSVVQGVTYFVLLLHDAVTSSYLLFLDLVSSVLYFIFFAFSLVFAYRLAPKTFKLRA